MRDPRTRDKKLFFIFMCNILKEKADVSHVAFRGQWHKKCMKVWTSCQNQLEILSLQIYWKADARLFLFILMDSELHILC